MGRVLIVDDDTDFVEVVRRRLTKAGHEAVAVTSEHGLPGCGAPSTDHHDG